MVLRQLVQEVQEHCQYVLRLRPNQFAVGMLEIEKNIEIVLQYGKDQRRDFIDENHVPIVLGPGGDFFLVDHHHFLTVCYHVGIKKVRIKVAKDVSRRRMIYSQFRKWMFKTRHAYPFCQFGEGPRNALYLPKDIRITVDSVLAFAKPFVRDPSSLAIFSKVRPR